MSEKKVHLLRCWISDDEGFLDVSKLHELPFEVLFIEGVGQMANVDGQALIVVRIFFLLCALLRALAWRSPNTAQMRFKSYLLFLLSLLLLREADEGLKQ